MTVVWDKIHIVDLWGNSCVYCLLQKIGHSLKLTWPGKKTRETELVTHYKIYHYSDREQWFPWNGFCDAISPHSSVEKTEPLFICSYKCTWPTQHSLAIFMKGAREPSLHPRVMIQITIWRLPLTKVFPVLYEQLFSSNQWWTTRTYTFSHQAKLQTISAILPHNAINQRALLQESDMKIVQWKRALDYRVLLLHGLGIF